VRPGLLRGPAFRRVDVRGARRCPELQPLSLAEGLDPDRDGCRIRAGANSRAAIPAGTHADANAGPDTDGPLALARSAAHLAAAPELAPAAWLAATRSWLANAGSPPSRLLVTVVVSAPGQAGEA
jgi:hypothetical protein